MDKITKSIRKDRPNVRDITIKNYIRYLNTLSKNVEDKELTSLKFLEDFDKVKKYLEGVRLSTRKSYIASILVALRTCGDSCKDVLGKYRLYLLDINKKYETDKGDREKTDRENNNWATMKDLHGIREKLYKEVLDNHIPQKNGLNSKNNTILQKYLVASLYTLQPPRRNIYSSVQLINNLDFKKISEEELRKNYLVYNKPKTNLFFWFGKQKSKNFKDKDQKVEINKKLKKVLKLWFKFNSDSEYLLTNSRGGKMTENQLTKYLNKIFKIGDKKISSSMIRKIYITEETSDAHKKIEDTAKKMGHTPAEAKKSYVKDK